MSWPKGDNTTSVTQVTSAQLIALLLTSRFVGMFLEWTGIPNTQENVAEIAVILNTVATHVYAWFASTPGINPPKT